MIANGRHSIQILSAVVLLLLSIGSSQAASTPDVAGDVPVLHPTHEGSVRIETRVDRSTAQIAEPITMSLAVIAPESFLIMFPELGSTLGTFDVVDVHDRFDIPEPTDSQPKARRWTRTYTLESLTAGSHAIPSVSVQTTDRRGGEPVHDTIASKSATVQIVSLVEGQTDPTQFRDIKGVVSLAEPATDGHPWLWYATGTGLLLGIATVGLVAWRRRGKPLSADAWALAELDHIERHVMNGQPVQTLYVGVTDVVRRYIELRFGLHAPRLTTTEFLSAVQHEEALRSSHRAPLQEFLTRADMVKFACLEPTETEAVATIATARQFVVQTAQEEFSPRESSKEKVYA